MYLYDEIDQRLVDERVRAVRRPDAALPRRPALGGRVQGAAPAQRALHPALCADAAHRDPLRSLVDPQLRKLADISRRYDRGYGHFTTRQCLQLNWPKLEQVPEILAELATVQMHAIQTSGSGFRNVTTDHFSGVAKDEIVESFVWCEILRQWSTFHPEFTYLPRKFKIAVNGAQSGPSRGRRA